MIDSIRKPIVGASAVVIVLLAGVAFIALRPSAADFEFRPQNAAATNHPPVQSMDGVADSPEALKEALAKKPDHVPVLLRMGQMALENGQADMAVKHLEEAVGAEPDNLDARLELGRALYQKGDIEAAVEQTQQILARDPNHSDALYNMGAIEANRGRIDLARDYWEKAVEVAPTASASGKAKSGLEALNGRGPATMPDIPEHRGAIDSETQRILLQHAGRK